MTETEPDSKGASSQIVGRAPELAAVERFLAEPVSHAFLLVGEPGVGKTTVWEAGVAAASGQGIRVLSARPSDAEAQLSFAALADLLGEVDTATLDAPRPQLRALEVALVRAEPEAEPPESFAIAAGFLSVLKTLSDGNPLLLAIDDVQWLDRPSAAVLTFAARRIAGHQVRFLLTRRNGEPTGLEQALEEPGLERLQVGPLSLGATRALLSRRLGLTVSRRVVRQIVETAQGNPLVMLELGRVLAERGLPDSGSELPLPRIAGDLFGARLQAVTEASRRPLLAVAFAGELTRAQLDAVCEADASEEALAAGLLIADGERVRTFHPLFAAAVRSAATPVERRTLHADLAGASADEPLRARHLALSADAVDEELAARVASAAHLALARGAPEDAVGLAEHALRLTPVESTERPGRLIALAEYLEVAGEMERLTQLLAPQVDALPESTRAQAHLLLAEATDDMDAHTEHLELALAASAGDPELQATVLARRAFFWATILVVRIREAESSASEALAQARAAGEDARQTALHALAVTRLMGGRPIGDSTGQAQTGASSLYASSFDFLAATRLMCRGQVGEARGILRRLLDVADARGEARSSSTLQGRLCEVELRAGMTKAAARLLEEADEWVIVMGRQGRASRAWCHALLAAVEGVPDEAERWAEEAAALADAIGVRGDQLDILRARGLAAIGAGDPGRAVEHLRAVWQHTEREGVDEPGVYPVAPDLVEALTQLGETDEATAVTERLATLAHEQEHPWGLATAERCRGLVRLASNDYDAAAPALSDAASAYEELGLRFDQARTLLALGRGERRLKKWGAARASLEQAAAVFDEIGAPGWAELARSELARVGARRPQPAGELTPAEARVAELAAEGLSNKEIAQALFISVYTVERHLKHVYAKLGIRSRGQLAQRLRAPS